MLKVVGTMFFNNRKLLIDKPRKRPTYYIFIVLFFGRGVGSFGGFRRFGYF